MGSGPEQLDAQGGDLLGVLVFGFGFVVMGPLVFE